MSLITGSILLSRMPVLANEAGEYELSFFKKIANITLLIQRPLSKNGQQVYRKRYSSFLFVYSKNFN